MSFPNVGEVIGAVCLHDPLNLADTKRISVTKSHDGDYILNGKFISSKAFTFDFIGNIGLLTCLPFYILQEVKISSFVRNTQIY